MYILTRAIIILLSVSAVSYILSFVTTGFIYSQRPMPIMDYVLLPATILLLCLVIYFGLIKTQWLTSTIFQMHGPLDEPLDLQEFAQGLRLAAVLAGLMMIPGAISAVRELIRFIDLKQAGFGYWYWISIAHNILRISLSAYLISGAPQYIRWQAEKEITQISTT